MYILKLFGLKSKLSNSKTFLLSAIYQPNHDAQYRELIINNFEKAVNINPDIIDSW